MATNSAINRPDVRMRPSPALRSIPAAARIRAFLGTRLLPFALLVAAATSPSAPGQVAGSMDVWPRNASVEVGTSRQFGAYVPISPNTIVWLVNDIPGGNATLGTISTSGLYQAPAIAPANNVLEIKARSTAFPSSFAATPLTVTRKYPWLWGASPSSVQTGSYQVSLNGSNFAPDSEAVANGVPLPTLYLSPTRLIATGTAPASGTIQFAVRQPAPGAVTGNAVSVQIKSGSVGVTVSPATANLALGQSRPFSATVTGTSNTGVTWSVNGVTGGSAVLGTITSGGVYKAPMAMPASPTVVIRAVSSAAPSVYGQATVTLGAAPNLTVVVTPASAAVQLGGSQPFAATVTGGDGSAVTWSVNGIPGGSATVGTISLAGLYSAPTTLPASPNVTVRATAVANPAAFADATVTLTSPPPVTVTVNPATATVQVGASQAFAATVTGSANTAVTWSVNGLAGGSATVGTVSASGLYTAPATVPATPTVILRATSAANVLAYAQATVTVVAAPTANVAVAPPTATVQLGQAQAFAATVTGNANTAVTWSVNGLAGGSATVGTISPAGVYTAPVAMPASSTLTIRATSVAVPGSFAQATVTLVPVPVPPAPSGLLTAARILEQTSFGPTPTSLAHVQQVGLTAYLDEQFALPETPIPTPSGNSLGALRQWALYNYSTAPDQLRQRVAYSLSQIVVCSGAKLPYADEMLPWLRLLSQHAFGNYRDLLLDVTRSPSMGKYLDLANSMKPGAGGGANENYPRELLQLFSIGLWQLNSDGSTATNALGQPIPAYDQETVRQVALALTGWTYATAPGATPQNNNWEHFGAPMEARQQNHATEAKSFLGCDLPAGQTVEQDLASVVDCLMNHPNIAPFVATRLIRSLVKSNPTGGYIQRVAAVFDDNGYGVRGDLKAVVRAILTDAEARNDLAGPQDGRLKEPILHTAGFLRALGGGFGSGQQITYLYDYMAQAVLAPPSVFSWFSPLYRVPGTSLFGPEFQIYTPTEATLRGNLFYSFLSSSGGDTTVDLTPFQPYGSDLPGLVEKVNQALLYGRMPEGMKQALVTAAAPGYDANTRIQTVLYLTALSGHYAVQH
jgi:hypothetical protein